MCECVCTLVCACVRVCKYMCMRMCVCVCHVRTYICAACGGSAVRTCAAVARAGAAAVATAPSRARRSPAAFPHTRDFAILFINHAHVNIYKYKL